MYFFNSAITVLVIFCVLKEPTKGLYYNENEIDAFAYDVHGIAVYGLVFNPLYCAINPMHLVNLVKQWAYEKGFLKN